MYHFVFIFSFFPFSCSRNYAVQYVILMQIPSAVAILASQFEGRYVLLSTQKFSSNVVENCLKHFPENHRATIIHELLSVTRFEELMQDPFANYVIQTALKHSKVNITRKKKNKKSVIQEFMSEPFALQGYSRVLL